MEEKLHDYPFTGDFWLDLEQTGVGNDGPIHLELSSGKTLVYMNIFDQNRSSKLSRDIVIAGYFVKPKGFFKYFEADKIRLVPDSEKQHIKSELIRKLSSKGTMPIQLVSFWGN